MTAFDLDGAPIVLLRLIGTAHIAPHLADDRKQFRLRLWLALHFGFDAVFRHSQQLRGRNVTRRRVRVSRVKNRNQEIVRLSGRRLCGGGAIAFPRRAVALLQRALLGADRALRFHHHLGGKARHRHRKHDPCQHQRPAPLQEFFRRIACRMRHGAQGQLVGKTGNVIGEGIDGGVTLLGAYRGSFIENRCQLGILFGVCIQ